MVSTLRYCDLTEPQRRMLDRAAADEDGYAMYWTRWDKRVGRNLADLGLGETDWYSFRLNESGRALTK